MCRGLHFDEFHDDLCKYFFALADALAPPKIIACGDGSRRRDQAVVVTLTCRHPVSSGWSVHLMQ